MAKVEIYTKGYCPFCHRAKALLKRKGVRFVEHPVERNRTLEREMIERANGGFTVPQIFIGDRHIGGSDDLDALDRSGKLDGLLA